MGRRGGRGTVAAAGAGQPSVLADRARAHDLGAGPRAVIRPSRPGVAGMSTTAGGGDAPPAEWNQTQRPFRDDIPIGVLLTEAAEAHAGQPAVIIGTTGQTRVLWTYAELATEARGTPRL